MGTAGSGLGTEFEPGGLRLPTCMAPPGGPASARTARPRPHAGRTPRPSPGRHALARRPCASLLSPGRPALARPPERPAYLQNAPPLSRQSRPLPRLRLRLNPSRFSQLTTRLSAGGTSKSAGALCSLGGARTAGNCRLPSLKLSHLPIPPTPPRRERIPPKKHLVSLAHLVQRVLCRMLPLSTGSLE